MDRQYIDDNNVVARYLADRLSVAEREMFEAYYLEHPEMLKELNLTAQFQSGVMALRESGGVERLRERRSERRRAVSVALAAIPVLAIFVLAIFVLTIFVLAILGRS